jgi:hypothetical protein
MASHTRNPQRMLTSLQVSGRGDLPGGFRQAAAEIFRSCRRPGS